MTSRFSEIIVDCHDPHRLASFWCVVLGYRVIDDQGHLVEIADWDPSVEAIRAGPVAPSIVFVIVPETKTVKNRLHIDVSPIDGSQEDEVHRLIELGARHVDVGQGEQTWVVLADPEGNEFCVLRSLAR